MGAIRGLHDIFLYGPLAVIFDIIGDGIFEEGRLLVDEAEGSPKVMDVVVRYVNPIDEYLPSTGVVEALKELVDGRLAAF